MTLRIGLVGTKVMGAKRARVLAAVQSFVQQIPGGHSVVPEGASVMAN